MHSGIIKTTDSPSKITDDDGWVEAESTPFDDKSDENSSEFPTLNSMGMMEKAVDQMIVASGFSPLDFTGGDKMIAFPQDYIFPVDHVSECVFGSGKIDGVRASDVMNSKRYGYSPQKDSDISIFLFKSFGKKVCITNFFIKITCEDNVERLLPGCLNAWDRSVFYAICALLMQGATCFTSRQVLAILNGRPAKDKCENSTLKDINNSIDRMMSATIAIGWSKLLQAYGYRVSPDLSCVTQTKVLPIERRDVCARNGRMVSGFKVLEEPELIRLAKVLKQIATIDIRCLRFKSRRTERKILIRDYLLRRIVQYHNSKNQKANPVIVLDTVMDECEIIVRSSVQKSRVKTDIYEILEDLQNSGIIRGYEKQRSRKEVTAVRIH